MWHAAVIYQQASSLNAHLSPLQRSRVHAELSVVHAQLRREQDATRSAGLAEELYPDDPEQDPSFLYAEFTPASLTLEQGLTYVALAEQYPGRNPGRGYQHRAADIFSRIEKATSQAPARIQLEIINYQAATAVLLNDLDAFEIYMNRALEGVSMLASRQRRREIKIAWSRAVSVWPHERRLSALNEGLQVIEDDTTEELA
jgi:hypothetical protein